MRPRISLTERSRLKDLRFGLAQSTSRSLLFCNKSRQYHIDGRIRLSGVWAPSGGVTAEKTSKDDSHALLLRAGFLRQAYSGVFHLLPLGLRVQEKIERLIDKHMSKLGASKLSLSSITSEALWKKSGRFDSNSNSELLRLNARSGHGFMLSPTHEEEITTLVAGSLKSYKELPIRLYQVTRKYRDERRPRGGLLRTREFLMKDLYTFDIDDTAALETYHQVKNAYNDIFKELKIKYLEAEADSGAMGGNYSHEFHFATPVGEDNIISCDECSYVANEELAERKARSEFSEMPTEVSTFISQDGYALIKVYHGNPVDPKTGLQIGLNTHALKKALASMKIDFGVEEPIKQWLHNQKLTQLAGKSGQSHNVIHIFDGPLASRSDELTQNDSAQSDTPNTTILEDPQTGRPFDLTGIMNGDACPRCASGHLSVQRAVELGHTFHLGTRYSEPLGAAVAAPGVSKDQKVAVSMGCHGIGITRMIAAVSSILADGKGLNWPRVIAPYEVVVIAGKDLEDDAGAVYDVLAAKTDAALDDRMHSMVWKLNDADLIGYPVVVVLGRSWKQQRKCEVQCRRLGNLREEVALDELPAFVAGLLERL